MLQENGKTTFQDVMEMINQGQKSDDDNDGLLAEEVEEEQQPSAAATAARKRPVEDCSSPPGTRRNISKYQQPSYESFHYRCEEKHFHTTWLNLKNVKPARLRVLEDKVKGEAGFQ